ncbi:hypothetical protein DNAM5_4 [Haloarcula californiae tailed virus 1]|uniref:Uncharacterized protein n=1 Tax=Haloarcula californiae tailed virus 1 TaxID=1273746 RepID=R4TMB7_9CAUD|nr:hypothetical protein M202_gp004 [Haloarcula californiae tailed virus 1]AGM11867.1 hypothetical protein DNAM5_4 [Haloarcula californiae tailed virus 1]
MLELPPWQDIVLAIGGVVGVLTKLYALADSQTVWTRRSSVPNAAFFIPTIAAFVSLELWLTAGTATASFLIWCGIAIWRAPEDDDEQ